MEINRQLDLLPILQKKSCFLLGPRQTGKTFLIRATLSNYKYYDLLQTDVYLRLSRSPQRLREELDENDKIVIIDEIQKLPILLDEIHGLIESKGIHFLLTGSSSRKLRRRGTNFLGGRARVKHLHPFIFQELDEQFDLLKALDVGLIPSIYFSDEPFDDLESYVGAYLQEEIAAEALVRNIPAFSRFLSVAGLCNGQMINYTNIASDAEVARTTVIDYFQILRDTLIGRDLPAWKGSTNRKPISTSKFYFFDSGVARFLQNRQNLKMGSPEFGEAFEAYIHHELSAYCDYQKVKDLHYWRSTSGFEVDFILNQKTAIEVKGKTLITQKDLKGLKALQEENMMERYIVVCLEPVPRVNREGFPTEGSTTDGRNAEGRPTGPRSNEITILPWQEFLNRLWQGQFN